MGNLSGVAFLRFGGATLTEEWQVYFIDGVKVKIYNATKTVVDCFKYKSKIGLDTAIEALRETKKRQRCSMPDSILDYCALTTKSAPPVDKKT